MCKKSVKGDGMGRTAGRSTHDNGVNEKWDERPTGVTANNALLDCWSSSSRCQRHEGLLECHRGNHPETKTMSYHKPRQW